MRAHLVAAALLAAITGPARAAMDATPADAERMAQLFEAVCLRAFPDDTAADRVAAQQNGVPLSPAEVREMLHDDPGRGWRLVRPEATYLLTIESPPWHACALRRMTTAGLPTTAPYDAAIERYAAARGRTLAAPASQSAVRGEMQISATVREVPGSMGPGLTDALMLFRTVYLRRDEGAPKVEVRFVHQQRKAGLPP